MPTVVATNAQGYSVAGSTTSQTFAVTAGQKVIVFAMWQSSAAVPTLSASATLLQTGIVGTTVSSGSWYGAWVIDIAADNPSFNVTLTKADGFTSVWCVVVDGPFTTTESTELEDTSAPWSHSITTTAAGALIVGFFAPENQADMTAIDSTPSGFTEGAEILSFSFWGGAVAHRQAATVGTYTWTPAITGGGTVLRAGLVLVALYGPALSWRNSVAKLKVAGNWVNVMARNRIAGVFNGGTPKGYK